MYDTKNTDVDQKNSTDRGGKAEPVVDSNSSYQNYNFLYVILLFVLVAVVFIVIVALVLVVRKIKNDRQKR